MKKVSQEIIDQIKLIQYKKDHIVKQLGQVEIATEELQDRKQSILNYHRSVLEEENILSQYISTLYGNGVLNTDTGEYTPNETQNTTDHLPGS